MCFTFSLLADSQVNDSFSVLARVVDHLMATGRRQRISKTGFDTYSQWQSERANYVVQDAGQIVGLVTLRQEFLEEWPEVHSLGRVPMIRALATDPAHRGKGIGAFALREAMKRCGQHEPIYLDCVSDFLPTYYASFGFTPVAQQWRDYPDDAPYHITLMRAAPQIVS